MSDFLKEVQRQAAIEYHRQQREETGLLEEDPLMAELGFKPKNIALENPETANNGAIGWFVDSIQHGGAGVGKGQAELSAAYTGVGGDLAKYLGEVQYRNRRNKEYSAKDMIPFNSDYYTNPQGFIYSTGNLIGSMLVLGGETAAIAAAAEPALALFGIGGLQSVAATLAGRAAAAGMPKLASALNSPLGVIMVGNIAKTPIEVSSEMGNTIADVRDAGGNLEEQKKAAIKNGLVQMPLLTLSNTLEATGMGALFGEVGKSAGKSVVGKAAKGAGVIVGGATQQAWEEGMQEASGNYATGERKNLSGVVNPFDWNDEEFRAAAEAFPSGAFFGAAGAGGASLAKRNKLIKAYEDSSDIAGGEIAANGLENTNIVNSENQQGIYEKNTSSDKESFINAIAGQESGGDYEAVNERTGAAGKYQVMPDNWPTWSAEAGLSENAPMTPENQEIVARYKLGQYYDKYGAKGAAIAWYAGEGALEYSEAALNRKQGNGDEPSINEYADSILGRIGNPDKNIYKASDKEMREYLVENQYQFNAETNNDIDEALETNNPEKIKQIYGQIFARYEKNKNFYETKEHQADDFNSGKLENQSTNLEANDPIFNAKLNNKKINSLNSAIKKDYGTLMKQPSLSKLESQENLRNVKRQLTPEGTGFLPKEYYDNPESLGLKQRLLDALNKLNVQKYDDVERDSIKKQNKFESSNEIQDRAKKIVSKLKTMRLNQKEQERVDEYSRLFDEAEAQYKYKTAEDGFLPQEYYDNPESLGLKQRLLDALNKLNVQKYDDVEKRFTKAKKLGLKSTEDAVDKNDWYATEQEKAINDINQKQESGKTINTTAVSRALADPKAVSIAQNAASGNESAQKTFSRFMPEVREALLKKVVPVDNLNSDKTNIGRVSALERKLKNSLLVPMTKKAFAGDSKSMEKFKLLKPEVQETLKSMTNIGISSDANIASEKQKTTDVTSDTSGGITLSSGYTTESGRPLSEASEREFIVKPDGGIDFGEITTEMEEESKGKLKKGKIRLVVGNKSYGLIHCKKHEAEAISNGYNSMEDFIYDITANFDKVYESSKNKNNYILVKTGKKSSGIINGFSPVYFELNFDGENYYIVISAIPKGDKNLQRSIKKESLIYSSPRLDTTTTSNSSAVAKLDGINVGADNLVAASDKSRDSFINSNLSQNQDTVNDQQTSNDNASNRKEYKNTQVKAQISFTAKGEKLLPQTAELRGKEITVISKAVKNASDNENLMGLTLPIGSYKLTVDDWEKAGKSYANQNYGWHKLIQSKFIEAFPDTGESKEYQTISDPLYSRIVDNQISAIKQAVKAYYDSHPSDIKQNRFDGNRAESSLDKLIGRKTQNSQQFINVFNEHELDAEIEKAKAEISKLNANPIFNPTLMKSLVKIGGIYIQKGINNFANWTSQMINTMGEDVRPFLKSVWSCLQAYPNNVQFNDDIMTAVMEFVGNRIDNNKDFASIKAEFAEKYGEEYLAYVEAAHKGIVDYPTEIENKVKTIIDNKQEEVEVSEGEDLNSKSKISFNENKEHNGLEISFSEKPDEEVINGLKLAGYRWSSKNKFWYSKISRKSVDFAKILGYNSEKVTESGKENIIKKEGVSYVGDSSGIQGLSERNESQGVHDTEKERNSRADSGKNDRFGEGKLQPNSRDTFGEESSAERGRGGYVKGNATSSVPRDGSSRVGERGIVQKLKPSQRKNAKQSEIPGHNFTIQDSDDIGGGGLKTKYANNVAAIKLLKELESDNRLATPEEQKILAKYVGWGGLAPVFNVYERESKNWIQEREELQNILTKEEYASARASTLNAHYTSIDVIRGIWDIVERLGFKGGRVLEPAMGVGNYFGAMPEKIRSKSSLVGIELDELTGKIAKQLYQKANIEITGFEKVNIPDNFYDLIISNVPFGDYKLHDTKYDKLNLNIHNYFFAKSIDKVRPGGIVCFITSTGTMQSGKDSLVLRNILSNKADLIGAVKLPNTAFKGNANTSVTTDLLILQKRVDNSQAVGNNLWLNTEEIEVQDKSNQRNYKLPINEYFKRNPQMLLGKLVKDEMYYANGNGRLALDGTGIDIAKSLSNVLESFPKNIYKPLVSNRNIDSNKSAQTFLAKVGTRENSFIISDKDGKAYQNISGEMLAVADSQQNKVIAYVELRNSVKDILAAQIDPTIAESSLLKLRDALNKAYDKFVNEYGYINGRANIKSLSIDPEYGIVCSVEKYKHDKKSNKETASKNDIFFKRTVNAVVPITKADQASDALAYSLAQKGTVDIDYMAKLMNKSSDEVVRNLEGFIYQDPVSRNYVTAEEYLSGNVREKLEAAETAAKLDGKYNENIEALKKVQPTELSPEEISVGLGSPWIPEQDVESFAQHLLGASQRVLGIKYSSVIGSWVVSWERGYQAVNAKKGTASTSTWGTNDRNLADILDYALNQKSPVVYDTNDDGSKVVNASKTAAVQEKVNAVKVEFSKWIWSEKERAERLAAYYNRNFNNWRLREYDGSSLTFPGYSAVAPKLRTHQKNGVWRIIQDGTALLAHCVGAGKTWTMQTAAMELKRLGLVNKSMFVIPNHMLAQFENEFRLIYPNAKIITISSENLPDVNVANSKKLSKEEYEKRRAVKNASRQKMLGRLATEDWDGIIISHNMFKRIPMSPELYNRFYEDEIEKVRSAIIEMKQQEGKADNRIVKELESKVKSLEEKLKKDVNEEAKDTVIPFEQIGIDQIFVDEADQFKNLYFSTKMSRVSGLSNSSSQRSMDMFMKTQYLTKMNNGRGVVFATGTPISNTMAEMFTMLRYLDMKGLEEKNISFFDNWAANFATKETVVERSPDGSGYRQVEKFSSFRNVPELIKMFRKVADVKRQEDLNLDIPKLKNGKPTIVEVECNEILTNYIKNDVKNRSDAVRSKSVDPSEDNMLKITSDLRKASLDMRLIDSSIPGGVADGKIKAVADNVFIKYKEAEDLKGAQLIFCDLSTPKGASDKISETDDLEGKDYSEETENITIYAEIKKKLIKKGIKADEIAFIHDAKNKDQKEELFSKVRSGEVRVLIGSTEKMGAGTNIQDKLVALHHVDAPWRPRDIEQREGRILRQGNENKEVEIFNYVTKDSFDANMWEKLKSKANMISQAMSGNLISRTIEDVDATVLNFAEVEALASGNPLMAEKTIVDSDVNRFGMLRNSYMQNKNKNERKLFAIPALLSQSKNILRNAETDLKNRKDISGEKFNMTIGKTNFNSRSEAEKALNKFVAEYDNITGSIVGKIGGFGVHLQKVKANSYQTIADKTYHFTSDDVLCKLVGQNSYSCQPKLGSIEYSTMHGPEKLIEESKNTIEVLTKEEIDLKTELSKPFEHEAKLTSLLKRQAEINKELKLDELGGKVETKADANTSYSIRGNDNIVTTDENLKNDQQKGTVDIAKVLTGKEKYQEDDKQRINRSIEELKEEAKKAFPNAKFEHIDGNNMVFIVPNGATIRFNLKDKIIVHGRYAAKAQGDHGLAKSGTQEAEGFERKIDEGALIALSQNSQVGTAFHEAFHAVWDLVLTSKEKSAMLKYYGPKANGKSVYEVMADAYRDWKLKREQGKGTLFGKLMQKVKDFIYAAQRMFANTDEIENIMRDIENGEVWNRDGEKSVSKDVKTSYKVTNDKITGDTLIPILDVTGQPKVNVNSNAEKVAIAKSLVGKIFRIIGSDGIGRVASIGDGKHLVGGSKNPYRTDDTRVKSLSKIEDVLNNAIYIDKHIDMQHGTKNRYIELYSVVKDGNSLTRFRIVAKEGDKAAGEYEVKEAKFYDIIKDGTLSSNPPKGVSTAHIPQIGTQLQQKDNVPSYAIRLADLLKGVKDREGNFYVNKDDSLNYEDKIFDNALTTSSTDVNYSVRASVENLAENLKAMISKKQDERIKVEEKSVKKKDTFGMNQLYRWSPSYIAEKFPVFKLFFKLADTAMQRQEYLRNMFNKALSNRVYNLLKNNQDKDDWGATLIKGDVEGKEYTHDELKMQGLSDNAVKAYLRTRQLIKKAGELLNDARTRVRQYQKNITVEQLEELRKSKFVKIVKLDLAEDGNYLVVYKKPKTWVKTVAIDKDSLEDFKQQENVQILKSERLESGDYSIKYEQSLGKMTSLSGYIPHFFHEFFIMRSNADGSRTVIGSAKTTKEAIYKAEKYLDLHPEFKDDVIIAPKSFSFEGDEEMLRAATIGDSQYIAMTKKIQEELEMSPAEAKEFLHGKVKVKSRHRFFGNFMKRKGVEGFESDMDWVLSHYFNATARYVALEDFKPNAIGLFERYFGRFDDDYSNNRIAYYTKQFINDINGNPSVIETAINDFLNSNSWWRKHVSSNFGDRIALQVANRITGAVSILKLGCFNVSSALLNVAQLMNTVGLTGDFAAVAGGMKNAIKIKHTYKENRIFHETGIMNDMTLDATSGYGKMRAGDIANSTMYLFRKADMYARKATVLAAYYKGIKDGMSHLEAIAYAKDINRKANFDYSVADAPNIFRRGSVLSQIAFQFMKYPMKEIELMGYLIKKGDLKQNAKFWSTYFLMCGLLQIPAFDWFDEMFKNMFGWSPRLQGKKMIFEWAGDDPIKKELSKIAMYGLSASIAGVDVSSRAGIGDVSLGSKSTVYGLLTGATGSTIEQSCKAIADFIQGEGSALAVARALSPSVGNIMQALGGETVGARGRKNSTLENNYEILLKATGFKNVDESIEKDTERILKEEKRLRLDERKKVIDRVIKKQERGEKIDQNDVAELRRLKVTGKQLANERKNKKLSAAERFKNGLSKEELSSNKAILNFMEK